MLGQTSAGKTHTMQALLEAVAGILESVRIFADGACELECCELRGDTRGAVRDLLQSGEPGCVALKIHDQHTFAGQDLSNSLGPELEMSCMTEVDVCMQTAANLDRR